MSAQTVGDLLGRCLLAAGATRVFGSSASGISGVPGLGHVLVQDPALAALFADAAGRLGPGPGVALLPGARLRLSSRPGAEAVVIDITDASQLPAEVAGWAGLAPAAAVELVLDLDLDAPAPADVEPLELGPAGNQPVLSPTMADLRLVVLAGPGVVRAGADAIEGLRTFAAQAGCGVLNTFGAKGVFGWDDPHHFGTIGLQSRDVELSGLGDAELIVAVGLDPDESPLGTWLPHASVLEVEPWQLAALAIRWAPPDGVPARPALYHELAALAGGWYESEVVPLNPARAACDLSVVRRGDGIVVAEPGPAGLWIGRTFPTTEPGSVIVPATAAAGIAAAIATVAALGGRPALAVATSPFDPATEAVLELATAWRAGLVMCEWGADAHLPTAAEHRQLLRVALEQPEPTHVPVPIDVSLTDDLVALAGEVVAWTS
jgi:thiamine pyrophosphate-dependent acetolactate synthase large subunit-like protein